MDKMFHNVSFKASRLVTHTYSTSFSIGVKCLHPSIRDAIYGIYGFVRLTDEIVDTFHDYNNEKLLYEFEEEYYKALNHKISMNPILNAFQHTVHRYNIHNDLVQAFFKSMRSDLKSLNSTELDINEYIYGSAEVIGLMCLKVFVKGDYKEYEKLKPYAMRLGAAFQKINFLRDLRHDINELHRIYFPVLKQRSLDETVKKEILNDIYEDYAVAEKGIKQLPRCARLGVYTAYLYYKSLTKCIEKTPVNQLLQNRIRINNGKKLLLFGKAYVTNRFN